MSTLISFRFSHEFKAILALWNFLVDETGKKEEHLPWIEHISLM